MVSVIASFIITPTLMYLIPVIIIDKYQMTALEIGFSEPTFGIGMIVGSLIICAKMNALLGIRYTAFF